MLTRFLILMCCLWAANVFASKGGTDAYGCHQQTGGTYHCHKGPNEGQSYESKEAALKSGKLELKPTNPSARKPGKKKRASKAKASTSSDASSSGEVSLEEVPVE